VRRREGGGETLFLLSGDLVLGKKGGEGADNVARGREKVYQGGGERTCRLCLIKKRGLHTEKEGGVPQTGGSGRRKGKDASVLRERLLRGKSENTSMTERRGRERGKG